MPTSCGNWSTARPACGPRCPTCPRRAPSGGRPTARGWRASRRRPAAERSGGRQPGVVVADGAAVGEELAVVVEQHDAVAQQPPALLGVAAHDDGQVPGVTVDVGARGKMLAHDGPSVVGTSDDLSAVTFRAGSITEFGQCAPALKPDSVTTVTRSPQGVVRSCQ